MVSWILFRDICLSGVSRRKFAQRVVEELRGKLQETLLEKMQLHKEISLKLTNLLKKAKNICNFKML